MREAIACLVANGTCLADQPQVAGKGNNAHLLGMEAMGKKKSVAAGTCHGLYTTSRERTSNSSGGALHMRSANRLSAEMRSELASAGPSRLWGLPNSCCSSSFVAALTCAGQEGGGGKERRLHEAAACTASGWARRQRLAYTCCCVVAPTSSPQPPSPASSPDYMSRAWWLHGPNTLC